jgi:thiol-disulfide isomerase/thioredoxin
VPWGGGRGTNDGRHPDTEEIPMSANIREIEASDYDPMVLRAPEPVVLDFFSTECPPCEALAPKYEAVADQFAGKVHFLKIFRQGNRELAAKLGVTSSPTLLFFKNGEERGARLTGDIKRSEIKAAVESLLG